MKVHLLIIPIEGSHSPFSFSHHLVFKSGNYYCVSLLFHKASLCKFTQFPIITKFPEIRVHHSCLAFCLLQVNFDPWCLPIISLGSSLKISPKKKLQLHLKTILSLSPVCTVYYLELFTFSLKDFIFIFLLFFI